MNITNKIGDVTNPEENLPIIIPHCVNDANVMGSGVALALYKKWPDVKQLYHDWADDEVFDNTELNGCEFTSGPFRLGEIQIIRVQHGIYVANMVGQRNTWDFHKIPPVRYEAIRECLWNLRDWLETQKKKINICSPEFASHLAGGSWPKVVDIINEVFDETTFEWTVYTLK